MKVLVSAIFACSLAASACGGGIKEVDLPSPELPSAALRSMPAGEASISIRAPEPGAELSNPIEVSVEVEGFRLVSQSGGPPTAGEGHIVYYSGADYQVPVAPDRLATQGGSGTFTSAPSADTTYRWDGTGPGSWLFAAQLVGGNGAPLNPPQVATVSVAVSA